MSEELIQAAKERIADLLEPINGGTGEDISYDEKFEELKSEVEKIASLAGETPNWGTVALIAEELLQEKSKDFRVACYLATCKAREGDLDKLLDSLLLLREITNSFWDDMFPPLRRIRARAGMVGWYSDQSGDYVKEMSLNSQHNAIVKAIDDESKALDAMFREKFADHYTGITKLRDGVRHLVRTCPKEKPKEEPKPAEAPAKPAPAQAQQATAQPAPAAPAPVVAVGDIGSMDDANRALSTLGESLRKMAASIRSIKPEDPMAYRLMRYGMWLRLNQPPATREAQKTAFPAPKPTKRARLDALASSNDFLQLLNAAESEAAIAPLWLDPHRFAATAMSGLGAIFMKARDELLLNVALFLRRVPTLPKLQFLDGTPFADGQTQMWIEEEVLPVLASGDEGGGGPGIGALEEPLKEARALAVKGELAKALGVISGAAAGAPTPAMKFQAQLAMAQMCLGGGHYSVARSQLEGLTAQIDRHDLTVWDPRICINAYAALYAAIKGMNDAKRKKKPATPARPGDAPPVSLDEEAAELAAFQQLCRLDPAAALKLSGG